MGLLLDYWICGLMEMGVSFCSAMHGRQPLQKPTQRKTRGKERLSRRLKEALGIEQRGPHVAAGEGGDLDAVALGQAELR